MKPIMTASLVRRVRRQRQSGIAERHARLKVTLSRWGSSNRHPTAWSTSGRLIRHSLQIAGCPTWERWLRLDSTPCSSLTTPISIGCGISGTRIRLTPIPSNPRWLVAQPFLFYDQLQTWTGIFNTQMTSTGRLAVLPLSAAQLACAAPPAAPATDGSARCAARSSRLAPLSAPLVELSTGIGTQDPPAPAYDGPGSGTGAGEGEDNGAGRPGESPEPCACASTG